MAGRNRLWREFCAESSWSVDCVAVAVAVNDWVNVCDQVNVCVARGGFELCFGVRRENPSDVDVCGQLVPRLSRSS
jgi:hypothetical protein